MKFSSYEKAAIGIIFCVCVVGAVLGYAIPREAVPPKKVWFEAQAGDVLFPHRYHTSLAQCSACHHDLQEGMKPGQVEMNCRSCHYWGEASEMESDDQTHKRFIGAGCIECHKEYEMDVSCESCHLRRGLAFRESGLVRPLLPDIVEFETKEGRVKFNHKLHLGEDVGEPCLTCHHEFKGGEGMEPLKKSKSCRACHYELASRIPGSDDENHKRHIGANCAECHEGEDCSTCHQK